MSSSSVMSSSRTSAATPIPKFRRSFKARWPDVTLRQARMYVADSRRPAIAWMIAKPRPRFAPVQRITCPSAKEEDREDMIYKRGKWCWSILLSKLKRQRKDRCSLGK